MNRRHEKTGKSERLEWLAERWLAAEADEAEERELRDALREAGELPASLRELRVLFDGLEALAEERMPAAVGKTSQPVAALRRAPRWRVLRWAAAAVAAAVVAVGIFLGVGRLRTPYCYIDGVAIYDREVAMQATVYFDSFAVLDAPNRLVDQLLETEQTKCETPK